MGQALQARRKDRPSQAIAAALDEVLPASEKVRRTVSTALLVALLAFITLGVTTYFTTRSMLTSSRWVTHTYEVISEIHALESDVLRAESQARAFLLTRDSAHLAGGRAAVIAAQDHFDRLQRLTVDNRAQQARLRHMKDALDDRLQDIRIATSPIGDEANGVGAIDDFARRDRVSKFTGLLRDAEADEQRLLKARSARESREGRFAEAVVVLVSFTAVVLAILGWRTLVDDLERRREVDRMKSELVAVAAHELKAPLTVIRSSLTLLNSRAEWASDPQNAALIQMAMTNSDRLLRLVANTLDIERIESGLVDLQVKSLDADVLVAEAVESTMPLASSLGVVMTAESQPDVKISGDHDRLQQVLVNLLSNAIKFSPHGATVRVTTSRVNGDVRIAVRDQGPGIPAAARERLFTKFGRVTTVEPRVKGGTGLGLAISKAIVEEHNGTIGVQSEPGKGSEFYITLPAAQP